jgi:hypothetical protein
LFDYVIALDVGEVGAFLTRIAPVASRAAGIAGRSRV